MLVNDYIKENHINIKCWQLGLAITANLMRYHAKYGVDYNLKKLAKQAHVSILTIKRCIAGVNLNLSNYYAINNVLIQQLHYGK